MSLERSADAALLGLLRELRAAGYHFVTPSPETHRRVIARKENASASLRDAFGWSLPFDLAILSPELRISLVDAGVVVPAGALWRSRVRVSSLGDRLILHSAYPTVERESVFFGPDSYRFAAFLRTELPRAGSVRRLVDVGCGAGAGAIVAAAYTPGARLTLTDINPTALRFARVNTQDAGIEIELLEGSGLKPVRGTIDLCIANPPFMADAGHRAYRDGGGMRGAALSIDWALEAAERIKPGGRILLYSGSAIVAGRDRLGETLAERLPAFGCTLRYEEIDPDIFGEQLDQTGYDEVERIAAVGAVITKV